MVRLGAGRLELRGSAEGDWPALHAIESREDVARFQSFAPRAAKGAWADS